MARRLASDPRFRTPAALTALPGWVAASLPLAAFVAIGWLNGPAWDRFESHTLVAEALLRGRVWFDLPSTDGYELVPRDDGGWLSPFPPLPALVLVPFVATGIGAIDTNLLAAVCGAVAVALMWSCLGLLGVERRARMALTIGFALGSELLWIATWGGQHLFPQALAAAFLLGALRLGLAGQAPLVAGLCVGLAGAARLPVLLAIPLVLYLFPTRRWPALLVGFAVAAVGIGLYGVARFGSPIELGYDRIVYDDGSSVLDEPWYAHGITSIAYLPRSLGTMLFAGFEVVDRPPWLRPGWAGASILLTMPILLWAFEARGRLAVVAAATAALVLLPDLLHGNPGWAQFGYRFILDALPILWLVVGLGLRAGIGRAALAAIGVGVAVNVYGTAVLAAGAFD